MTDPTPPRRRPTGAGGMVAVAALLALVAGACSSSSARPGAVPTTTPAPTAATTSTPASTPSSSSYASGSTTTQPPGGGTATRVAYSAPVDLHGTAAAGVHVTSTVSGQCHPGSDAVGNVTVYRCFATNGIYDPCWAMVTSGSAGSVLCQLSPWSKDAVEIRSGGVDPHIEVQSPYLGHPWGVELTTGQRCLAQQGARSDFQGRTIDYSCSGGSPTGLSLLADPDRSRPQWTFQTVTGQSRPAPGPTVTVSTAWFAGPPPPPSSPACTGAQLAVRVGPPVRAGADTAYPVVFTNTASDPCRIVGYPGVAALDGAGHQVQQATRTTHGNLGGVAPGVALPTVYLPAGGSASALVEGTSRSGCPAYRSLLVTAPNTRTSRTLQLAGPGVPGCGTLQVHPVVSGTQGT